MKPWFNKPYRNATMVANLLLKRLQAAETDKDAVALARQWSEIENMKREWRGIPRLSSATLSEIAQIKRSKHLEARPIESFVEIESEEGTLNPQTVPAPPTPMPPSETGVDYEKPTHIAPTTFQESSQTSDPDQDSLPESQSQ